MRRLVFHLHGFDPRGPAFYHALYREEAAKQALVTGQRLRVGPRRTAGAHTALWTVEDEGAAAPAVTDFELQRWDDIVRRHWPRGTLGALGATLRYAWAFLRSGMVLHVFRLQPHRVLTVVMPFAALLLVVAAALLAAGLLAFALQILLAWPAWTSLLALPAAALLAVAAVGHLERTTQLFWLARIFAFTDAEARGRAAASDPRKDALAARLADHVASGRYDEILVSSHSVGAVFAISAVARALEIDPELARRGPSLALMTLGQSLPLVGAHPAADRFRRELAICGHAEGLTWVDVSAGADPACFYRIDPLAACNVVRAAGTQAGRPKLVAARFYDQFSPETYRTLRTHKNRLHFSYLTAAEKPGDYDFFAITGGSLPLAARFS